VGSKGSFSLTLPVCLRDFYFA